MYQPRSTKLVEHVFQICSVIHEYIDTKGHLQEHFFMNLLVYKQIYTYVQTHIQTENNTLLLKRTTEQSMKKKHNKYECCKKKS